MTQRYNDCGHKRYSDGGHKRYSDDRRNTRTCSITARNATARSTLACDIATLHCNDGSGRNTTLQFGKRYSNGSAAARKATAALRRSDGSATARKAATTMDVTEAKNFVFFFLNDSWQVQESSTSSSAREKERKKERERKRKSFETCFGLAFPSSSAFV